MNFNQLINEIRKLNPGVEIRIGDERFDREARSRIFSSVPMHQLKLPEGYYSNEKNGITNKHTSKTGLYTTINIEDISKVNPELLVSTGYDLEKEKTKQYEIDIERKEKNNDVQLTIEQEPTNQNSKRTFSILKRERQMNDAKRAKNKAAIMAGICILGASVAFYFNNQDLSAVISHELNAIYSWEALGQYLNDLGPLTTLLSVGAAGFISKYLKNSKKLKQAQNDFEDFNNSLENEQIKGDDHDAKAR